MYLLKAADSTNIFGINYLTLTAIQDSDVVCYFPFDVEINTNNKNCYPQKTALRFIILKLLGFSQSPSWINSFCLENEYHSYILRVLNKIHIFYILFYHQKIPI